jgi:antitoxin VapB
MALSIKNREVEELARELARVTKKPITEAVRDSLQRELERAKLLARAQPPQPDLAERLMEIGRRMASLPDLDTRSADEILGYDEHGLPR